MRKIIHMDMDAFFASVEQRNNPELRGKAVVVGSDSNRGVVAAASYEARKFNIHSAMSSIAAKKLCPNLIFVHSNFAVYKEVSNQIMAIFKEYTDLVEPLSIDEAFLDVTNNFKGIKSATMIAQEIRKRVFEETELTISAGVSYNMFLAKLASGMNKPNGLTLILPEDAQNLLEKLKIEKFYGVGKATAAKMHKCGIHTGKDLKELSPATLTRLFGKSGLRFYDMCRGIDNREVCPWQERKSLGTERTFEKDLNTNFERIAELYHVAKELEKRIKKTNFKGKTITLKIKFADFKQISRSTTLEQDILSFDILLNSAKKMLAQLKIEQTSIRLIGLSISNVNSKPSHRQMTIDF